MSYQVVLQWSSEALDDDFERLVEMEDALIGGLGAIGVVDGHDAGSGEFNIFIFTDEPQAAFHKAKEILGGRKDWAEVRAAYRGISAEEYVVLWPRELLAFSVK